MKIHAIKSKENKSDKLDISENVLSINNESYDFDKLLSPNIEESADNKSFFKKNRCYIDADGEKHINIYINHEHQFLFVNNNYLLFHDKDLNGDIDIDELADFIKLYNLPEEERKKEHFEYKNKFTNEQWAKRRKQCGQIK